MAFNPFRGAQETQAAVPLAVSACITNPACVGAFMSLSGATYAAVSEAIKETSVYLNEKKEKDSGKSLPVKTAGNSGGDNEPEDPEGGEVIKQLSKLTLKEAVSRLLEGFDIQKHEGGEHEGHTIERHTKPDINYLRNRLDINDMDKVSSYTNSDIANKAISEVIKRNQYQIEDWWLSSKPYSEKRFFTEFEEVIGYTLRKGSDKLEPSKKARVVLKKDGRWLNKDSKLLSNRLRG